MTTSNAIPLTGAWTLIYDAAVSGSFVGTVNLLTNDAVQYRVASSLPAQTDPGFARAPVFRIRLSSRSGDKLYGRSTDGSALVVLDDNTVPDGLPVGLFTSTPDAEGYQRMRVDPAQTGFFEGREFRTFHRWPTDTTAIQVIKAVVPINIILFELGVTLVAGEVLVETLVGGTEGGTFATSLFIAPTNTMSEKPQPAYVNQVLLTTGGTLTGGTLLDPLIGKASDNANKASSVGAEAGAERGVGANTYYFRITLTAARGNFKARWEERP